MDRKEENALWQEIVDRYDETAPGDLPREDLDEPGPTTEELDAAATESDEELEAAATEEPADAPLPWEDEGHFTPPRPEPIPLATPPRMLAWLGVFGSPVIALVALVAGHPFRGVLGLLMVAWFVGGFLYLVHTMRDEPRDPWDDGSRI